MSIDEEKISDFVNLDELRDMLPDNMDINALLDTLDTPQNDKIIDKNKQSIQNMKNKMLQSIGLERDKLIQYNKSLKDYMYVDDISELNYGSYLRWIPLDVIEKKKEIKLVNGGFLTDINFADKGIILKIKIFGNRFLNIYFDKCMIFQKLSENEQILLELIQYVN